jgi:transposase
MDLRERVVVAVEEKGLSRHEAAARYGVGVSTAIKWVQRFRKTGSLAPGQMGGHKPRAIRDEHETWLRERIRERDFTLRGLVAELAERGLKVDYHSVWDFVHREELSFKKNRARKRAGSRSRRTPAGAMDRPTAPDRSCPSGLPR